MYVVIFSSDFVIVCSQVYQYPVSADSTIPSAKKRKFDEFEDSTADDKCNFSYI